MFTISYIHHDGFLIETESTYLLFDYWNGDLPSLKSEKPLLVFASHAHQDHFSFEALTLTAGHPDTVYILSNDIHRKFGHNAFLKRGVTEEQYAGILFVHRDECHQIGEWEIRTLASTDQGVAFVVTERREDAAGGGGAASGKRPLRFYHAGDLNDWTWPGNDEAVNRKEQDDYHRILEPLEGMAFDAAFVPCDPRQGDGYWRGVDYFMRLTDTREVYPMHFWDDVSVINRLVADDVSEPYRERIASPSRYTRNM